MSASSTTEVPADILPIAILIDELKHEDANLRLLATKQLDTIAVALGPERTREELIPFLIESVDDEDEIILALAGQLGSRFIPLVGGPEHAFVLLAPLELLAGVEETAVREKAVASIAAVAEAMPLQHIRDYLWPLADKFGRKDWFTARAAACGMLPRLYARLPSRTGGKGGGSDSKMDEDHHHHSASSSSSSSPESEPYRENALALYQRLANDETPMVKRAASLCFPDMASAVAGGKLPDPSAADKEGPVEPAAVGGAGSARAGAGSESKMLEDTGTILSSSSTKSTIDGLNVDTGDMTSAAVPPPVPKAIVVSAADREAGAQAVSTMLPILATFARDDQDSVRLFSVDNCVALARLLNGGMQSVTDGSAFAGQALGDHETLRGHVLDFVTTLANDRAWRVRWSVSNRFGELSLAFGSEITTNRLLPVYEAMLNDHEAEVRTAASYRVADIGRLVGKARVLEDLMPSVDRLSTDASEHVRAALASVILGLSPVLEHQTTIETLLPLFLRLLKDTSPQVRLNIISKLEAVNAVIGLKVLSQSLLPAISELSTDKQWRVRLAIIDFVPLLASQLGQEFFAAELTDLCVRWLTDPVYAIREAAAINLRKLTEVFGSSWAEADILPRLLQLANAGGVAIPPASSGLFHHHSGTSIETLVSSTETSSFQLRMTSLQATVAVGTAVSQATLQSAVLPFLLQFALDPVPNIRFNLAKALTVLAPRLDATTKAGDLRRILDGLAQDAQQDVQYYAIKALAAL